MTKKNLMKARFGFTIFLILFMTGTFAHPGHEKNISEQELIQRAKLNINRLVDQKKLEDSWNRSAKVYSVEKRYVSDEIEYALAFENPDLKNTAKSTLYIFLTASGDYITANFSGK